jgi:hypothetical protein
VKLELLEEIADVDDAMCGIILRNGYIYIDHTWHNVAY